MSDLSLSRMKALARRAGTLYPQSRYLQRKWFGATVRMIKNGSHILYCADRPAPSKSSTPIDWSAYQTKQKGGNKWKK